MLHSIKALDFTLKNKHQYCTPAKRKKNLADESRMLCKMYGWREKDKGIFTQGTLFPVQSDFGGLHAKYAVSE